MLNRGLSTGHMRQEDRGPRETYPADMPWLIVSLKDRCFGLAADEVKEIVINPSVNPVPELPPCAGFEPLDSWYGKRTDSRQDLVLLLATEQLMDNG